MMEILAIIGIIIVGIIVFTGGILGWIFKGLGSVFDLLLDGWHSLLKVIVWTILIIIFLTALLAG